MRKASRTLVSAAGLVRVQFVVVHYFRGTASAQEYERSAIATKRENGVDIVHTFRLGLPRTPIELARTPHVSTISQCYQGSESRSSPTSGTANPLYGGGVCFSVWTFWFRRSL